MTTSTGNRSPAGGADAGSDDTRRTDPRAAPAGAVPDQMPRHGPRMGETPAGEQLPVAPPGRVDASRVAGLDDFPAGIPEAEAEVHVLGPVEVALVETAQALEGNTANQLAGADGEVDGPRVGRPRTRSSSATGPR